MKRLFPAILLALLSVAPAHAGSFRLAIGVGVPAPVYVAPAPVVVAAPAPAPLLWYQAADGTLYAVRAGVVVGAYVPRYASYYQLSGSAWVRCGTPAGCPCGPCHCGAVCPCTERR